LDQTSELTEGPECKLHLTAADTIYTHEGNLIEVELNDCGCNFQVVYSKTADFDNIQVLDMVDRKGSFAEGFDTPGKHKVYVRTVCNKKDVITAHEFIVIENPNKEIPSIKLIGTQEIEVGKPFYVSARCLDCGDAIQITCKGCLSFTSVGDYSYRAIVKDVGKIDIVLKGFLNGKENAVYYESFSAN